MKIIDLLNKIANEQEVPKKIKFNDYEYLYHDKEHGYCRNDYDCTYICLNNEYYLFDILNDEVEIIEEDKKIEKLHTSSDYTGVILSITDIETRNKINEIIDYINKEK